MNLEIKATLRLTWRALGAVKLNSKGKLVFPGTSGPNVYCISIETLDGERSRYIGETRDFERRVSDYRRTNQRINRLCKQVLDELGSVNIDVIDEAWVDVNGVEKSVDFHYRDMRRLFESFALVTTGGDDIELLNF